ncbi:MAG TPA: hypothetical protein VJ276_07335 [Thermoanaerobaculia bacterium]|nr:hypothetical protein [Thermoanaerobaculia bacterium]
MKLVDWFLKSTEGHSREAALAYERGRYAGVVSAEEARRQALAALAGSPAMLFGTLLTGEELWVGIETTDRHNIIVGATGSGKTRVHLDRVRTRLRLGLLDGFGYHLSDPKGETVRELKKHLTLWWLSADDDTKEAIQKAVHVIDWTSDRITPTAPLDNREQITTDAYAAELSTRLTLETSDAAYSDSLRQVLFMWNYLLIDHGYPPNFAFGLKFFRDAAYRAHVLARTKSPDVRQFFSSLSQLTATQTIDAFLRRLWGEQAFPEYRCAVGVPPEKLDQLNLPKNPRWVLANFATSNAQPPSLGHARFRWYAVRRLFAALRRPERAALWEAFEELQLLLTGSPEVIEILMTSLRVLRSFNVSLTLCAQSLTAALPHPVVENILLNTAHWTMLQARPSDAELLLPFLLLDPADRRSSSEKREEFLRQMASLPRQHFCFLAKGHPALFGRAPDVLDPAVETGRCEAELLEIFDREIAPHSMIPITLAQRLIAEWENEVVTQQQVAVNPAAPPTSTPPISNLNQLRQLLGQKGTP